MMGHRRHPDKVCAFMLAACLLWAGRPVQAHHSVTAMYDLSRVITLNGTVESLMLGSPHSHLAIKVPEPLGRYDTWQVELPSLSFLERAGWTDHTLSRGQHLTLIGSPARYTASQMYVRSITLANGTKLALLPGTAAP